MVASGAVIFTCNLSKCQGGPCRSPQASMASSSNLDNNIHNLPIENILKVLKSFPDTYLGISRWFILDKFLSVDIDNMIFQSTSQIAIYKQQQTTAQGITFSSSPLLR
ncbi:hypothetical protein Fot_04266 [Forsythia ovata]|uniref:Uncharacterized protein n=1 Tax=Forsythia ovata TaxID=205694 RepID=A0ABD1XC38_9LAMI